MTALITVAVMAAGTASAQAQEDCIPFFIFQVCAVQDALNTAAYVQETAQREAEALGNVPANVRQTAEREAAAAGDVQGIADSKLPGCGPERSAQVACARNGDDDMPRSGYTVDRVYDCGAIRGGRICWANGTTDPQRTEWHHWGWGSADYDGSGALVVCVGGMFSDCRERLARACYYASCNDQDIEADAIGIHHGHHDHNHTLFGHAKA